MTLHEKLSKLKETASIFIGYPALALLLFSLAGCGDGNNHTPDKRIVPVVAPAPSTETPLIKPFGTAIPTVEESLPRGETPTNADLLSGLSPQDGTSSPSAPKP
jgi:hypothetical protein